MNSGVEVKEFDGGRSMWISHRDGYVVLEFGEHCFMFEKGQIFRASERALEIAILDMGDVGESLEHMIAS